MEHRKCVGRSRAKRETCYGRYYVGKHTHIYVHLLEFSGWNSLSNRIFCLTANGFWNLRVDILHNNPVHVIFDSLRCAIMARRYSVGGCVVWIQQAVSKYEKHLQLGSQYDNKGFLWIFGV